MRHAAIGLAILIFNSVIVFAQPHVVVISVDGFRPDFYKDASWGMFNLRDAMMKGAYADGVRGVFPTVTYPSHTTMVTGVKPIKHGIWYNTPSEPLGVTGKWYWSYDSIKVPTIWSAAKNAGLVTAAVSWPVTVGAPITYNIPEIWDLPAKGSKELNRYDAYSKNATPAGLFEEIQENATGKIGNQGIDLDFLSSDENHARMGAYLIRKYKPAFIAVHIANVDHFEHEQGRDGVKVRAAVAGADHAIRTMMDAIEAAGLTDSTTFLIVGDHGFVDIHSALAPNILLVKAGLIDPEKRENWKAYFHSSGGSAFLHLKNKNDKQTLAKVREVLAALPEGDKKLFRVVDRREMDSIGADPNASLALAPVQGIAFSGSSEGGFVKAAKGGTHGYLPDFKEIQTGFVAFGRNINKDVVIPQMGLEDIAPLIARLLNLDFPSADGILYEGILSSKPQ
jgi:Type I phosphodiesterase / nucleotide pyrophosphatase